MRYPTRHRIRLLVPLLAAYAAALAILLPRLSLWLDELLTLIGVRGEPLDQILDYVAQNAGGVPLHYLLVALSIKVFGVSAFAARLPSLVSSVAACAGMFVLARRAGLHRCWLAVLLFAVTPLQFRYAIEARPYAAALSISIWSTVVLLWQLDRPTLGRKVIYEAVVLVGLYMQPFSVFIALAHLAWMLTGSRPRKDALGVAAGIAGAVLGFLPWFAYASSAWHEAIASDPVAPHYGSEQIDLVLKELVGIGYVGTVVVMVLALYGVRAVRFARLWLLCAIVPVLGAMAADILFGYFAAIRQMIFTVAPLMLLAAGGMERLSMLRRRLAGLVVAALLSACLYEDVRMFVRPREDWRAATQALHETTQAGACIIAIPEDSIELYGFFKPAIGAHTCGSESIRSHWIAVAISPYQTDPDPAVLDHKLTEQGWAKVSERDFAGPRILLYARPVD